MFSLCSEELQADSLHRVLLSCFELNPLKCYPWTDRDTSLKEGGRWESMPCQAKHVWCAQSGQVCKAAKLSLLKVRCVLGSNPLGCCCLCSLHWPGRWYRQHTGVLAEFTQQALNGSLYWTVFTEHWDVCNEESCLQSRMALEIITALQVEVHQVLI